MTNETFLTHTVENDKCAVCGLHFYSLVIVGTDLSGKTEDKEMWFAGDAGNFSCEEYQIKQIIE